MLMCAKKLKTLIGTAALCFGAGILAAYIFPGFIVAFLEAAVLLTAGILLIKR